MSRHWMACLSWSPSALPGGVIGAREQPQNEGRTMRNRLSTRPPAPRPRHAARVDARRQVRERRHERSHRPVQPLASAPAGLVQQEIWGHLCCHYAIRTLMADAAQHSGRDPDRMSFVAALRIARQSIAPRGAFPP